MSLQYYEKMKQYGISDTKQVFKALVNAYAACGQFEKANQVVEKAQQVYLLLATLLY